MFETVHGAELYYEEAGCGDRVVISAAQVLDPEGKGWPLDLAQEGFHVYALQMRGYGKSSHITENFSSGWYDVWADDVAAFARAKGIERFLYTGQSDGAGVGWHLCFAHPEMLVGFAGLSAGPHSRGCQPQPMRRANVEMLADPFLKEQLAQYQRQRMMRFVQKFADDAELKAEFERKAEALYQWQLAKTPEEVKIQPGIPLPQFKTDEELLDAMRRLTVPILLLNGMKDAMLPIGQTVITMGVIPNAKVVFYQDGTNALQYDFREDVRAEISRFATLLYQNRPMR